MNFTTIFMNYRVYSSRKLTSKQHTLFKKYITRFYWFNQVFFIYDHIHWTLLTFIMQMKKTDCLINVLKHNFLMILSIHCSETIRQNLLKICFLFHKTFENMYYIGFTSKLLSFLVHFLKAFAKMIAKYLLNYTEFFSKILLHLTDFFFF